MRVIASKTEVEWVGDRDEDSGPGECTKRLGGTKDRELEKTAGGRPVVSSVVCSVAPMCDATGGVAISCCSFSSKVETT